MNTQQALQQIESQDQRNRRIKKEWQTNHRRSFAAAHGYSTSSNYGCGGLREQVLERDGYKCVKCLMTDAEHKAKFGRPITIDHKDRNRQHNTMDNLQTLCLSCHGAKDLLPRLRQRQVEARKPEIIERRKSGATYQRIADEFGFSIAAIWKWVKAWEAEGTL